MFPLVPSFPTAFKLRAALPSDAQCQYDPELHDGPQNAFEAADERTAREDVAREVCANCPLLIQCETYRQTVRPTFGIWAGHAAYEMSELASTVRTEQNAEAA